MTVFCPRCGWDRVRYSVELRPLERILKLIGIRAYRCRTCRHRFWWPALGS